MHGNFTFHLRSHFILISGLHDNGMLLPHPFCYISQLVQVDSCKCKASPPRPSNRVQVSTSSFIANISLDYSSNFSTMFAAKDALCQHGEYTQCVLSPAARHCQVTTSFRSHKQNVHPFPLSLTTLHLALHPSSPFPSILSL